VEPIKIEEIYKEMCEKKNKSLYFYTYSVVKSILEKSYFPYLRDAKPFMTDHGIGHINRILEKISRFLMPHVPLEGNPNDRILDIENLNLLMHSILWHDIGNLYGRSNHPQNICKIFNEVKSFLYDSLYHEWILKIAKGHSGEGNIEKEIENISYVTIYDSEIYPRFLAALLRISDEIDEDRRRIGERVISIVPEANQPYWRFCFCNESIIPAYEMNTLSGTALEIQINCRMTVDDIKSKWGKNDSEVKAIEEYISRIYKINQERVYCNKFLRQQTFYFCEISRIKLKITICDDSNNMLDNMSFTFTDDEKESDFFNNDDAKSMLSKYGVI